MDTEPDTPTTQSELDEEESGAGQEVEDQGKEGGGYSPTKAILVPKPYLPGPGGKGLSEKKREQGRSGSAAGGLVGNLVMV